MRRDQAVGRLAKEKARGLGHEVHQCTWFNYQHGWLRCHRCPMVGDLRTDTLTVEGRLVTERCESDMYEISPISTPYTRTRAYGNSPGFIFRRKA